MVKYQHYRSSVALSEGRTLKRFFMLVCLVALFLSAPSLADREKDASSNELVFPLTQPFLNNGVQLAYYQAVCWRAERQSLRSKDHQILNAKARKLAANVLSIPGVTKCQFLFSQDKKPKPLLRVTKGLVFVWKDVIGPVQLALAQKPTPTKHPALMMTVYSPPEDKSLVYFHLNRELGQVDSPLSTRRQRSQMSIRLPAMKDSMASKTLNRLGLLGQRFASMLSKHFGSEALEVNFFDTYSGMVEFIEQHDDSHPVEISERQSTISRIIGEVYN